MAYSLRAARPEDAYGMMAIAHEGLRPSIEALWGWDAEDQRERFLAQFEPIHIAIIQLGGRDVGYMKVEDCEDCIYLAGIYLAKDDRSKGIGSQVLIDLMRKATEAAKPLRLRVLVPNPAKTLYARLGFRVTKTTDSHVYMEFEPNATQQCAADAAELGR